MKQQSWRDKISNPSQLGGIETSVLDNGPGRGTRIAWVNTGAGLRYKVVIDRAMDIVEASFNEHNLSWISHLGIASPQPLAHEGTEWLRTFSGGMVTTCGLSHFGPPEKDEHGERGLHGLISNQPAEVGSIIQPDPRRDRMDMTLTGTIRETQLFGPSFELRRTISGTLGEAKICIQDEVVNVANTPQPHMLLYHCNFGWPLVDEGTDILWRGTWRSAGRENDNKIFREGNDFRKAQAPREDHSGGGEAVVFIDPEPDASGRCVCGLHNAKLELAVALHFDHRELPCLTNWQRWGKGEYVTGLEPGTNPPIGQARARKENSLIILQPGEARSYNLTFEVLKGANTIREFLKKHKL